MAELSSRKEEMRLASVGLKFDLIQREWALEAKKEAMEEAMERMQSQLGMVSTYLHGVSNTVHLKRGKRGSGKYFVFQNRQFIDTEIALLANLTDFDFMELDRLDAWLVASGVAWKFLPYERCVLVTRIRKEKKDYGDVFTSMQLNCYNFQNIIWVRDGENVFRINCEMDFDNAVFPDKNEHEKVRQRVYDSIWKDSFKADDQSVKAYLKHGLQDDPCNCEEPYNAKEVTTHRFHTVEEWLDDPTMCPESLQTEIANKIMAYLRMKNGEQLKFMILIQGIVDHTSLLDIPKGTDLFNWEVTQAYFEMVFDYTHGLPDRTYQRELEPYVTKAKVGDWVIVSIPYDDTGSGSYGYSYRRPSVPALFQVHTVKDDGTLVIKRRLRSKRRRYDEVSDGFVRKPTSVDVKWPYVKLSVPLALVRNILNDREWKLANTWLVPFFCQWEYVLEQCKNPINQADIDLKDIKSHE